MERLERALHINGRVVLFTLLLLFGTDLLLEHFFIPRYLAAGSLKAGLKVPAVRRLPADDEETLKLWKEQLKSGEGLKVVFLGDSVVYGGGVPQENETIPAYFCRALRLLIPDQRVEVYNFSLPGCTPQDTLNILKFILDSKPDLVIYDVNIGWFGSKKAMEHPNLASLSKAEKNPAVPVASSSLDTELKNTRGRIEDVLTAFVSKHWVLYRNRIFLNYVFFGRPLREIVKVEVEPRQKENRAAGITEGNELYKPWYEKNFDVLKQTRGRLGYCNLDEGNVHWLMYNQLIYTLNKAGVKAVFFTVPRNSTLLARYDLLDRPVLSRQEEKLRKAAETRGIEVLDYTFLVDDRFFVDTVHPTREGNKVIGERLAIDLMRKGFIP